MKKSDSRLRSLNNLLTVVVCLLALYIILAPFLPQIWWWGQHITKKPDVNVVQVTNQKPNTKSSKSAKPMPTGYWLDIPRLEMHEQIYAGLSISELNKGVWHIPGTSTPDKGSNTVVAGHRFTYTSPRGVFYYLDKIQINDRVTVDWSGTEYTYRVSDIKEVRPNDLSVQAPSKNSLFTMYTCTPLLTAKNRLIVQSELVGRQSI